MTDTPALLADLAAQAPGAHALRAERGSVLFRPNDPCRGFIALRQGAIKVALTGATGREIVLYRVGAGDICLQTFACLVRGAAYAAEGVAESDLEGVFAPQAAFSRLLHESAAFREAVFHSIARRFGEFEQVVEMLAFTGLEARVCRGLLQAAGGNDDAHITDEQLAGEIGSAREAVSRQLGALARLGLVALSRGAVRLLDRRALARLAAGAETSVT